ncbi:phenylalanine--tRNA ligase, mitochondrial-like [Lingula anatina]|uniref:Phenylalanine--tRNA ligase, mitochondrial n=1 Tax=Lingula anatina TaxID=7574 RepID=A0A1S3HSM3_LINAN|nr:phenylalanine--tRNA ligase, mitochondrial-like [Lingula anatina]XP_013389038.1 phenylalanine--tRNA ligase, mitochondrial-like [Lingula anatina]XP_013389039.1 phenylalanine--tRNA ligase, mitochondrial-like [Lingula anatina]XP_013389040.1 phenylalanine--tRNA ligase, mitochondrial-like [Lingula anatina]XP_013389041.1 phenylalanine--tRNA ligase, mitochondrial-like [Lingula anatina]|eukprot:XP_013389037.1 phenylalanine--tRNA ligase, mitochondrial-like [Lingula anatina]
MMMKYKLFTGICCRLYSASIMSMNVASHRHFCSSFLTDISSPETTVTVGSQTYARDEMTNVTPHILSKVGSNLHNRKYHPLNLLKQRIRDHFYKNYVKPRGNPIFTVVDDLPPVVTIEQCFDSLLTPKDHVSRKPSDTYYVNRHHVLRTHTSAHQSDLIRMGCDQFLVIGDVYRRDTIDKSHYPVFHQCEGVRLFTERELLISKFSEQDMEGLTVFEQGPRIPAKQAPHTQDAVVLLEADLKWTLTRLAHDIFGKDIETQWVDCYFPFTHPSWELEIKYKGEWLEVLGCGVMEQEILNEAGAGNKVGWAFGLGLERWAMKMYDIPDIRLFWSQDSGFLSQFRVDDANTPIKYKPVSVHPQCYNDISFWIPDNYTENDFYDLVRGLGSDMVEQVELIDNFTHPKKGRTSHCYRITYRHMDRAVHQEEANKIHALITEAAINNLAVEVR